MPSFSGLFDSFQQRDFRLLWLATLGSSAGMWVQQVATGWLVLDMTDSPLALGAVQAARLAPFLVLGMPAGALADRVDRRALSIAISWLSAGYSLVMALLVALHLAELWQVLALTLLFGACRAFEAPVRQALVYDMVGASGALRGIALNGLAMPAMGIIGAMAGGAMIPFFGVQGAFVLMALGYSSSGIFLQYLSRTRRVAPPLQPRFWSSVREGFEIILHNRTVLLLVLMSMVAEAFAFSHQTVVPIFARDVLVAGAVGLGALTAARSGGALLATMLLATLNNYQDKVRLLLAAFIMFGTLLIAFALSRSFPLSIVLMIGVGGAATAFDLLQQTILQLSVPERDRGKAMGYWVASLGFGPVGHMELGLLATMLGAPLALGFNGIVVITACISLLLLWRRLPLPRESTPAAGLAS